ncbi:MAG: hypothetical protein ACKVW3_03625 [Phycisphaerales bacterium]
MGTWCNPLCPPDVGTASGGVSIPETLVPAQGISWESGRFSVPSGDFGGGQFNGTAYPLSVYSVYSRLDWNRFRTNERYSCPQSTEVEARGTTSGFVREQFTYELDQLSADRYVLNLNPVSVDIRAISENVISGSFFGDCEVYAAVSNPNPIQARVFLRVYFIATDATQPSARTLIWGIQGSMRLLNGRIIERLGSVFPPGPGYVATNDISAPPIECPLSPANIHLEESLTTLALDNYYVAFNAATDLRVFALRQINVFPGSTTDGDVNYSSSVDIMDRRAIIQLNGQTIGNDPDAKYEPRADFDWDGDIDSADLTAFDAQYCAADLNANGYIDANDYILFGNYYSAGSMYADFDGNNTLNINDYTAFMNIAAACP